VQWLQKEHHDKLVMTMAAMTHNYHSLQDISISPIKVHNFIHKNLWVDMMQGLVHAGNDFLTWYDSIRTPCMNILKVVEQSFLEKRCHINQIEGK
jgi:hypothetical protein